MSESLSNNPPGLRPAAEAHDPPMASEVDDLLERLSPDQQRTVLLVREVVRATVPAARESVLWGALSYHRPEVGGRVKGAVCLIVPRNGRVRLDFIHGIHLSDPKGLLRGDGVSKRYLPIDALGPIECKEIARLVREAATLDPARLA